MNVSVMIPSRGRPKLLLEAVNSLLDRAANPDKVEINVRADTDEAKEYLSVEWPKGVSLAFEPRVGYVEMAKMWNFLACASQGQWLYCFNDDAIMMTDDWDTIIEENAAHGPVLAGWDNSTSHGWPAFPIINRSVYARLGHITKFCGLDSWLVRVHRMAGREIFRVPIEVYHRREQLDDTTKHEGVDSPAVREACLDFDVTSREKWDALAREDAKKLWGAA